MIPLRDVIPSRTAPVLMVAVIAINVAVAVLQLGLDEPSQRAFIFTFGLVPANFSVAAIFTSMFVHAGLGHLGGNMLYLWIFGDNVEDRLGHGRFLLFYLLCGVAAAVAQSALNPSSTVPMVGASGAIAGVMGAYFVLYPRSRVLTLIPPFLLTELPAVALLGFWFLMQFLSGIGTLGDLGGDVNGGIAFWAHAVGFLAGAALVKPLARPERAKVDWWHSDLRR
ncbi:MAG: rhomboid family intramembrane serine protease [Vicinamibacterales bacterium]